MVKYSKILTRNDVGDSGSHQVGLHVPKASEGLIGFLPSLDLSIKNPSEILHCVDAQGELWKFRFVYYNNKYHSERGTRDEFRITRTTGFFRKYSAVEGAEFLICREERDEIYRVDVVNPVEAFEEGKVKLSGWKRVF